MSKRDRVPVEDDQDPGTGVKRNFDACRYNGKRHLRT
jgi:hypothetical protein